MHLSDLMDRKAGKSPVHKSSAEHDPRVPALGHACFHNCPRHCIIAFLILPASKRRRPKMSSGKPHLNHLLHTRHAMRQDGHSNFDNPFVILVLSACSIQAHVILAFSLATNLPKEMKSTLTAHPGIFSAIKSSTSSQVLKSIRFAADSAITSYQVLHPGSIC